MIGEDKKQIDGFLDESVGTQRENTRFYQSYVLHHWQDQPIAANEAPISQFVLQEVTGERRQHAFSSIEQVMNYLIDELLGKQITAGSKKR